MKSQRLVLRLVAPLGIGAGLFATRELVADCPEPVGRWPYGSAYAVAVSGSYAYFGSGSALMVANISNPAAPQVVGEVALPAIVSGVAFSGGFAYVSTDASGLRVIDVVPPSAPVEVGYVDTLDAEDVAVAGSYAYVADLFVGLWAIDVSTPSAPVEIGFADSPGDGRGVAVSDGHAYLADGGAGLGVFWDCSMLFADGFESGNTSAWSATVP